LGWAWVWGDVEDPQASSSKSPQTHVSWQVADYAAQTRAALCSHYGNVLEVDVCCLFLTCCFRQNVDSHAATWLFLSVFVLVWEVTSLVLSPVALLLLVPSLVLAPLSAAV
jgi:hypothetical protein